MSDTVTFDDVWKMFQETSKQFQETSKQLREMGAETDKKISNLSKMGAETDKRISNLSKEIGSLGNKWGEFVENMVAPACVTMFAERGIPVHQISQRVKTKLDGGRSMEIDVLVVNNKAAVLVEVKSTLTVSDVQDHIEDMKQFKEFFPQYEKYRVMGAVAGMIIGDGVDKFAKKQGLFVIVQSGETVTIDNDPGFVPHVW